MSARMPQRSYESNPEIGRQPKDDPLGRRPDPAATPKAVGRTALSGRVAVQSTDPRQQRAARAAGDLATRRALQRQQPERPNERR